MRYWVQHMQLLKDTETLSVFQVQEDSSLSSDEKLNKLFTNSWIDMTKARVIVVGHGELALANTTDAEVVDCWPKLSDGNDLAWMWRN